MRAYITAELPVANEGNTFLVSLPYAKKVEKNCLCVNLV